MAFVFGVLFLFFSNLCIDSAIAQRPRVIRDQIEPNWSEDGNRFWYRMDISRTDREFVLVDIESQTRQPAFDHTKVAEEYAKIVDGSGKSQTPMINRLEFTDQPNQWRLITDDGKQFFLDTDTGELIWENRDAVETAATTLFLPPRPSARSSGSIDIQIVNQLSEPIELVWINWEGEPQSYGMIAAGQSRDMGTYQDHVWLLKRGDKDLGCFSAKANLVVEVNQSLIENVTRDRSTSERTSRRRPPRQPRRQNNSGFVTSPDRNFEAFVQRHNLWLRRAEESLPLRLTKDATADHSFHRDASRDRLVSMQYDRPDYPESLPHVYWSPNSDYLIALQTTKVEERQVFYVLSSPTDQVQPRLMSYPYAKPGDPIPVPTPRLFRSVDGAEIELDQSLFSNPFSLSFERWSEDGTRAYWLFNQRGHQKMSLLEIELATGKVRPVVEELSDTFIHYSTGGKLEKHWIGDDRLIWASERSGWNHLYMIDVASGQMIHPITSGNWNVRNIERIDQDHQAIWFYAVGVYPDQDPYHWHFCRVNFDGSDFKILTQGDGTHTIRWSPDRSCFIDQYSRVDLPPVHELRSTETGDLICELERAIWTGRSIDDSVAQPSFNSLMPERFVAKGRDGQTDIWGIVHWPRDFDSNQKYPIIENIYAGPHSHHVPKKFTPRFGHQRRLADAGFIVVQIDGMGTAWRSKAFHDVCYQNIKDAGFPDRIAWVKALAEKYPQIDTQRVGIYGGSAGGQNAMAALIWHHDFYKAAAADCGCHDNRMDKIWWNEQWMGELGDSSHYIANSNVEHADKMQGHLLLTVGEADRNVDPASTTQVVDALIRANKDFVFLPIPNGGHGSGESSYPAQRRLDFFKEHLQ